MPKIVEEGEEGEEEHKEVDPRKGLLNEEEMFDEDKDSFDDIEHALDEID